MSKNGDIHQASCWWTNRDFPFSQWFPRRKRLKVKKNKKLRKKERERERKRKKEKEKENLRETTR